MPSPVAPAADERSAAGGGRHAARTTPRRRAGGPARCAGSARAGRFPSAVRQLQPQVGEGAGVAGDAVDVDRVGPAVPRVVEQPVGADDREVRAAPGVHAARFAGRRFPGARRRRSPRNQEDAVGGSPAGRNRPHGVTACSPRRTASSNPKPGSSGRQEAAGVDPAGGQGFGMTSSGFGKRPTRGSAGYRG